MKDQIKKTIDSIIHILSSNPTASRWVSPFETLRSELDIDYDSAVQSLKALFGGMGSFNDLVLHTDGIPLRSENNELDELSHILYEQLKTAILSRRANSDL
ncbi:DUF6966 domain-containing protein [Scandinavium goeteborgense]|uniref:DUF6966 domain-containing protein n=1 Tax=Scandinavium goeteborgense TaxID=1851514 RepID=UPI000F659108|nr:hypothetical protein [Scandinavium goeteborgense]QKN81209.1 hypothetical protein A8O29_007900 [Scandinavium goeteborgense]